jgi:hypothetical protein
MKILSSVISIFVAMSSSILLPSKGFATNHIVKASIKSARQSSPIILGGLNFDSYCKGRYPSGGLETTALLVSNSVYGWKCRQFFKPWPSNPDKSSEDYAINTNDVCRKQYGSNAQSAFLREDDPYSWVCYK